MPSCRTRHLHAVCADSGCVAAVQMTQQVSLALRLHSETLDRETLGMVRTDLEHQFPAAPDAPETGVASPAD